MSTNDKNNAMPFEPEPTKTPKPLNPVEAAYRDAMERYEIDKKAYRQKSIEDAWSNHETIRRKKVIHHFLEESFEPLDNPYENKSPAEVYRMTCNPETRLEDLLTAAKSCNDHADVYAEALKVWLYRRKSRADIDEVKRFFADHFEVSGDDKIEVVDTSEGGHYEGRGPFPKWIEDPKLSSYERAKYFGVDAERLSPKLKSVLGAASPDVVVRRGEVYFIAGEEQDTRPSHRGYVYILAHRDKHKFPPEYF